MFVVRPISLVHWWAEGENDRGVMKRTRIAALLVAWLVTVLVLPPAAHAQDDVSWLLGQINSLRAGLGLYPYTLNAELTNAATLHSQYMATTCDISHTEANGSTPRTRAAAAGYTGSWISENIYVGQSAATAWDFWIHSPVHYAGLTHGVVTEIGIGVATGYCGNSYTLLFGHRDGTSPPAAPAAVDAGAAAVAPTQPPYVPPPPTRTPTGTIPTVTPSATWTITPTYTPSGTPTAALPTAAALELPTVAVVAAAATLEPTTAPPSPTGTATPSPAPTETLIPGPAPTTAPVPAARDDDQLNTRRLIPLALLGQVILIGLAGMMYFRRGR